MNLTREILLVLVVCTALIALLIWDQSDRPVNEEIVVEPAVLVTPTTEAPTTTVDLSFLNTTTTVKRPPVTAAPSNATGSVDEFFACIRHRESRGNYGAVDRSGTFMGAYQFYQGGWDTFAGRIGRQDLIGVPPNMASPADQDAVALAAYNELGAKPWNGACQ